MADLRKKRSKEEALARHFRNNNAEYLKIRETIEARAYAVLSNRKRLLEFAALSVIESLRDPKYRSLIQYDVPSTTDYKNPDFNPFWIYGQQPQQPIRSKV